MRNDKQKAFSLRIEGKSYLEIKKQLNIPISTLSEWFKGQKWSNDIAKKCAKDAIQKSKIRIVALNNIRGQNLQKLYNEARNEAISDYEILKYHPLFISGLMIYWGEGEKNSRSRISIANTDPKMIKIFAMFIENICNIKNIKAWILLYPELNEVECKRYWIKNCDLKPEQFTKSIIIKGKSATKKLQYGVCNLGISSAYLKSKIIIWLDLLSKDLISESYLLSAGMV